MIVEVPARIAILAHCAGRFGLVPVETDPVGTNTFDAISVFGVVPLFPI